MHNIELLVPSDDYRLLLEFRREHVLQDALRHARKKKFNPKKTLKVLIQHKVVL